jgi:hypothetical protein
MNSAAGRGVPQPIGLLSPLPRKGSPAQFLNGLRQKNSLEVVRYMFFASPATWTGVVEDPEPLSVIWHERSYPELATKEEEGIGPK